MGKFAEASIDFLLVVPSWSNILCIGVFISDLVLMLSGANANLFSSFGSANPIASVSNVSKSS